MTKKSLLMVLSILLIIGLSPPLGFAKSPAGKVYTFKYASFFPAGSPSNRIQDQLLMDKATELSNGQIKWELYPSEQLGKASEFLELVQSGLADAAFFVQAFWAGKMPLTSWTQLPYMFDDAAQNTACSIYLWENMPEYRAYGEQLGFVLLAHEGMDDDFFHFRKPVKTFKDFKGLKVRSCGGIETDAIRAFGSVPVAMSAPDAYLALQRGTLDGILLHSSVMYDLKLHEVAPYTIVQSPPEAGYTNWVGFSLKRWNTLPSDIQKALLEAGKYTNQNSTRLMVAYGDEALKKMEAAGSNVYHMPKEETAKFVAASEPIWDLFAKQNGEAGAKMLRMIKEFVGK